jgi:peptide/nickel transport system substrate-binding protein
VEFTILGSIEARRDGRSVPLGGPKQRALLAILLLDANTPVSRDRLIEGLWGERQPPGAAQTLDSYLSKLRRALGPDRIVRRAPGYVLRVEPGELDLDRFERMVASAREAADGPTALRTLGQALAVWRGEALSDALAEPFAAEASRRLEERRLAALEERFDIEIALGRGPELIDELGTLVQEHPFRERLLGHLMLALYRSGRQADALDCLQRARHELAGDLGLEPGLQLRELERQILRHDESLGATRRPARAPKRRSRRAFAAVATATVVAAALAVTLVRAPGPAAGAQATRIQLPNAPAAMTSSDGSLWMTAPNEQLVLRVDPGSRKVIDRIPVSGQPGAITHGAGAIWVASTLGGAITRIDPATDRVTQTIQLGGANTAAIAFRAGKLWIADTIDHALVVLDARSGEVTDTFTLDLRPTAVVAGADGIWVADFDQALVAKIDPHTGRALLETRVGNGPAALNESDGSLWVASSSDSTLSRIDARTGVVATTIQVGRTPSAIAVSPAGVFVANQSSRTVSRIDPRTSRVVGTTAGGEATALAAGMGRVWIAVNQSSSAHRGGRLRLVTTQRFSTIDPAFQYSALPYIFGRLAYDGLVTFEASPGPAGLRLVPDLALTLPSTTGNGAIYTFRLRRGIRYSDGRTVRALDFRRAIERLFRVGSPGLSYFGGIVGADRCTRRSCTLARGIETDDVAGTVVFRLRAPDPDFLFKLTVLNFAAPIPPGVPAHDAGTTPVPGTGPYAIRAWTGREIRFARNPYFREWSHAAQPAGNPDEIVWKFAPSDSAAVEAVEQGQADWVTGFLPPEKRRELVVLHPSQIHLSPSLTFEFIPLNIHARPFDDVRVRRALNLAIDRGKIAALYGGAELAVPWCQAIAAGITGFQRRCPYTADPNEDGVWIGPDLAGARRLVRASGTNGARIDVWGTTDQTQIPSGLPAYVASVLRSLGYSARLHLVPHEKLTESRRKTIQLSVDGDWQPDYPAPSAYLPQFFGCDGGYSNGYVCVPALDRQMQRAATLQLADPPTAAAAWAQVDRTITDQALWVPTVQLNDQNFVSARLRNYQAHPVWGFMADQVWLR